MFKNKMFLKLLCLLCFLNFQASNGYAQCNATPSAVGLCSGGNGAVANSTNITSGKTYWWNGVSTTRSGVTLHGGGTLRVCGNLTLTSFTFNGGSIIIESGGSLTITGSISLNAGDSITNRGTVSISGSLTLQSTTSYVFNLSGASLTVGGTLTLNPGTLINSGSVTTKILTINSNGHMCMGNGAKTAISSSFTNNQTNGVVYSGTGASSCISLGNSSTGTLNNVVTSNSNIKFCLPSTFSLGAGWMSTNWGSASLSQPCTSCNTLLPLNVVDLAGNLNNNLINITWSQTGIIGSQQVFTIEESNDGSNFHPIGTVGAEQEKTAYSFADYNIQSSEQYYRIKQTDASGAIFYSNIIGIKTGNLPALSIYPNPINHTINFRIQSETNEELIISIKDMSGRILSTKKTMLETGSNNFSWELDAMKSGVYILNLQSGRNGLISKLISVVRQ